MLASVDLPARIPPDVLADACREVAVGARVQPFVVEKDYYLTRLIWGLAQTLGPGALLKGGTLLSKVDLDFHRMSEDVDLVSQKPTVPREDYDANGVMLELRTWLGLGH